MRIRPLFLPVLGWFCGLLPLEAQQGAAPAPAGTYFGLLSLVRYDLPVGRSDGYAPTRQLAQRQTGQDGVDWPDLTLNGAPIFRAGAEEKIALRLRSGASAASPFQLKEDDRLEPGHHWLRPIDWGGGLRHLYTADKTARTANTSETMSGRYELWTFPVRIAAEGAPVKIVVLKVGDRTIFEKDGPWRSLTLLLPATAPGQPYELSVDGRPPVRFEAGLMPVKLGSPREKVFPLDALVSGAGPAIRVQALTRPGTFPHPKEWAADLEALKQDHPAAAAVDRPARLARALGVEVPRSPMTIYAMQLPGGMSGGFPQQANGRFTGTPEEYAAFVADLGFDAVFDQGNTFPAPAEVNSFERRAAAMARHGLKLGLQYDNSARRPALQHPGAAFFSHTLPEWHAPLYRSLSLAAQRLSRLPNFLGFSVGASSDGYASGWFSSPPTPERPWAEGMIEFAGGQPEVPRAPGAGPPEHPFEYTAKTTADFLRFVQRYDASFQQYGYFAEAVRQVDPRLVFTTGCFGSSPGPGARGGWPWASLPGRVIFEGLDVQQAYDWNATHSAKPLHNVALTDRLLSYWPRTPAWSLLDNHQFLYGREGYQRACALALTRGIQAIGTNFLPSATGPGAPPAAAADEREMHAWIHRFGGVYARTEPLASIGIFYGQNEAVQRGVLTGRTPPAEQLFSGSHEGKVTEALFLCHAAGWPARVITYQEINRGPLPPSMRAILIVGCHPQDASWSSGRGLEKALTAFVARGGRILTDEDSTWSVPATPTKLRVAAYQPQSQLDATPLLFERNRENIEILRAAMEGIPSPLAVSSEPKLWAIPTQCGDTQYVTALNQAYAEGEEAKGMLLPPDPRASKAEIWKTKANASLYVKPQQGVLTWHTDRPIYDLRQMRRLSPDEAVQVDLAKDAFQYYALPPAEPTAPALSIEAAKDGAFEARVSVGEPNAMRGVPVKITVTEGEETVELFGATGFPIPLPFGEGLWSGQFRVTATELLSGLSRSVPFGFIPNPRRVAPPPIVALNDPSALLKFVGRKTPLLTVALTLEQEKDHALAEQARTLVRFYHQRGRTAVLGVAAPGGVVESLQPLQSPHRYPQWSTTATDLILFGTPANNVLILDQARGELFPLGFQTPSSGHAALLPTHSPFLGEYDVLNIVASDTAGFAAAVQRITK